MTPEFLATSIVVILLPGTGVLYTLAFGLSCGWRASVVAALGCTPGILPHIGASVVGLAEARQARLLEAPGVTPCPPPSRGRRFPSPSFA